METHSERAEERRYITSYGNERKSDFMKPGFSYDFWAPVKPHVFLRKVVSDIEKTVGRVDSKFMELRKNLAYDWNEIKQKHTYGTNGMFYYEDADERVYFTQSITPTLFEWERKSSVQGRLKINTADPIEQIEIEFGNTQSHVMSAYRITRPTPVHGRFLTQYLSSIYNVADHGFCAAIEIVPLPIVRIPKI